MRCLPRAGGKQVEGPRAARRAQEPERHLPCADGRCYRPEVRGEVALEDPVSMGLQVGQPSSSVAFWSATYGQEARLCDGGSCGPHAIGGCCEGRQTPKSLRLEVLVSGPCVSRCLCLCYWRTFLCIFDLMLGNCTVIAQARPQSSQVTISSQREDRCVRHL